MTHVWETNPWHYSTKKQENFHQSEATQIIHSVMRCWHRNGWMKNVFFMQSILWFLLNFSIFLTLTLYVLIITIVMVFSLNIPRQKN